MKICEICRARFKGDPETCPLDGGRLVELPDPMIGRTIAGRYLIREKIGQGGMGTVYRARHEVVGRDVAVKFLSPDLSLQPEYKTRFLREARAANKINHEHIIDVTDFGETEDGHVYLAMEYLDGRPLNVAIARQELDVVQSLRVALQVARALGRAHELGVIHRDIKPDNIYLLAGYTGVFVKLLDFGLAQMKGELRVTATGTVFGTPEYMAPEQARGAPLTFAADLYALGCVLFEMLAGRLPFRGNTPDLVIKHIREQPPSVREFAPDVPEGVEHIVGRLLAKKPDERFENAFALADALTAELENLEADTGAPIKRNSFVPHTVEGDIVGIDALVESWRARLGVLEDLARKAHPNGRPPAWLPERLALMRQRVDAMVAARDRLSDAASEVNDAELQTRASRLRIGKALDALATDEARAAAAANEARAAIVHAEAELKEGGRRLPAALRAVQNIHASKPTNDELEAMATLGELARKQLDAVATLATEQRTLARLEAERDDLQFQMGQLKGRMGSLSAVSEVDLEPMRDSLRDLERSIRDDLEAVVAEAGPVVRHFMSFPHLRDRVRTAANTQS